MDTVKTCATRAVGSKRFVCALFACAVVSAPLCA